VDEYKQFEADFKISAYLLQSKVSTVIEKPWKQSIPKPTPIKRHFDYHFRILRYTDRICGPYFTGHILGWTQPH